MRSLWKADSKNVYITGPYSIDFKGATYDESTDVFGFQNTYIKVNLREGLKIPVNDFIIKFNFKAQGNYVILFGIKPHSTRFILYLRNGCIMIIGDRKLCNSATGSNLNNNQWHRLELKCFPG